MQYSNKTTTTIRVLVHNMLPYATTKEKSPFVSGFLGDIWNILQKEMNFKSVIQNVDYDDGLEIINSRQADVMLAAAIANNARKNVEYTQPYLYNWYHLYIKYPEARASPSFYAKTLNQDVWLASFFFFMTFTFAVWLTTKFLKAHGVKEKQASLYCCFMSVVAGFLNQGFDLKLKRLSSRMQLITALLFGMVLYSSMNALLVSKLANSEINMPFACLDDIAERKTHSLCVRTNSFVYNNFTYANGSLLPKWRDIVNGNGCLDIINQTNLAQVLCQNNVVVLENRVVMANIKKNFQLQCEILNTQERYFKMGNSVAMLKNFQYKKTIRNLVKKLHNNGILRYLEYKWISKPQPVNVIAPMFYQVTLEHIYGILAFYGGVISVCVLILILEILTDRCYVVTSNILLLKRMIFGKRQDGTKLVKM